jgi:rhodanese-related sulfurtransferase
MISFIKKLFGIKEVDFAELLSKGALIIDVRSKAEFRGGHIEGALNIPLRNLNTQLNTLDKNRTFILCCASGARSASARSVLRSSGFDSVYNGGSWSRLQHKLHLS